MGNEPSNEEQNEEKKQVGISFSLRFLAIHGVQPLSWFAGLNGHDKSVHVQKETGIRTPPGLNLIQTMYH